MTRNARISTEISSQRDPGLNSRASSASVSPHQPNEFPGWSQPLTFDSFEHKNPQFSQIYMTESEPHTPVEQMHSNLQHPYDTKHRFGSVSSVATTDDEDAGGNEILYPWTEQQDSLLKKTYEEMLQSPQLTPFSGRYPPSGILHRVSKDALKIAKYQKINFPHSLNATRQRILFHCHDENGDTHGNLHKIQVPSDYFFTTMPPINNDAGDLDEFEFTDMFSSSRRQSIDEKYGNRQQTLQPAFREPAPQPLTEEDIVNIVAKRKRDSLRMKRGPH